MKRKGIIAIVLASLMVIGSMFVAGCDQLSSDVICLDTAEEIAEYFNLGAHGDADDDRNLQLAGYAVGSDVAQRVALQWYAKQKMKIVKMECQVIWIPEVEKGGRTDAYFKQIYNERFTTTIFTANFDIERDVESYHDATATPESTKSGYSRLKENLDIGEQIGALCEKEGIANTKAATSYKVNKIKIYIIPQK